MRRTARDPDEGFGDVIGSQRLDAFVNFLRARFVAFEADDGELRFRKTGIDRADAHAGAGEFEAKGFGDLQFARLGRAVGGAAFVGDASGDGADVDDRAAGILHHERQAGARDAEHAEDIRLHHEFPVFILAVSDGFQTFRAAGVVDQHVELVGATTRPIDEGVYARGAGDIECGEYRVRCAKFFAFSGDGFESVQPAGTEQELRAFTGKGAGGGGTESAGSTGDEDPFAGK